jgi:putative ABC transport system permease protein
MVVAPKTVRTPEGRLSNNEAIVSFYTRVVDEVAHMPGVEYAAISDSLPPDLEGESDTFSIAGQAWSDQAFPSTTVPKVSPEYFRALGVPLLRGRFFTEADTGKSPPVVIISESLARRYFANVDPIGQKIRASGPTNTDPYMTVVGVVGDVKYIGMEVHAQQAYYMPYTQTVPPTAFLVIRSPQPAGSLAPTIEQDIRAIDKDAVVRRTLTLADILSDSVAQPRFRTMVVTGFGSIALMLAAIGIYGVIAYAVTQRTQEIGIRMALGAQRWDVLKMVMSNGVMIAGVGVAIGAAVTLATGRVLARFLFDTGAHDPVVLATGCALLTAVAMVASLVPALRATRIDPQQALRNE